MFNSKLKEEIRTLRDLLERAQKDGENYRQQLMELHRKQQGNYIPVSASYTLTESDYINFISEGSRKRAARQRMAMSLASKIVKSFEPEEVIEDGTLIGYKYALGVKRMAENPRLGPVWQDVRPMIDNYEAIWKEGQGRN